MKNPKTYTIIKERRGQKTEITRTLAEFIEYFGYVLETGKSWEHRKGCKKINLAPKTIRSLVTNLNNAKSNASGNGHSDTYYELKTNE